MVLPRTNYQVSYEKNPSSLTYRGTFTTDGTAAPSLVKGVGFTVGAPSPTGVYTVTLERAYRDYYGFSVDLGNGTTSNDAAFVVQQSFDGGANTTVTSDGYSTWATNSGNNVLKVKTSPAAAFVSITVTSSASLTTALLAESLNTGFEAAGLLELLALSIPDTSVYGATGNALKIINQNPGGVIIFDSVANGSTLLTPLSQGFSPASFQGSEFDSAGFTATPSNTPATFKIVTQSVDGTAANLTGPEVSFSISVSTG